MSKTGTHVAVLKGGWSAEREVSLVSGGACAEALRGEGYTVTEIDVDRHVAATLSELNPDVVFNALHGPWGEDGSVQGILEVLDIPYTHSGVLASALAMDKGRAKAVFRDAGLPVADSVVLTRSAAAKDPQMPLPFVIKPVNEGSSVGVFIFDESTNKSPSAIMEVGRAQDLMLVEEYVPGRELTVSVMGEKALAVTEIISHTGWYDYEAKYAKGGSSHVVPAEIPEPIYKECLDLALKAHASLGCRGVSRTDFLFDEENNRLVILETNTQPGMTPTSLSPEQAQSVGISFGELVSWMVEDASCGR